MRTILTLLVIAPLLAALTSCAAPGVEISRQPGDFAFLEVNLRG